MKILILAIAFLILPAFAGPVSHFGALQVCSNNICGSKTGSSLPVLLKGPSLYWSDGSGVAFYNLETVDWFVDNMQIGVIRAAMGIRYYEDGKEDVNKSGGVAGYYFDASTQKGLIKTIIEAAILNDIYVIVDWHSHNAHQNTEPALAKAFFKEMATEYKDVPNIIWEVYNEPINASAAQITSYANGVIDEIRGVGNNNLVLVGSGSWSQNPSAQAINMFNSGSAAQQKNVAFTFHFYAATHTYSTSSGIAGSADSARTNGYAVFGSEWGFTEASGAGSIVNGSSWTSWMDNNNISNCNWSVSNFENSSMFKSGTNINNLSTSNLSTSGGYFQTYMGSNKWTSKIPTNNPKGNDVVASVNDGSSVTLSATDLGLTGTISEVSQPENGEATHTSNSITYTTSSRGSPNAKERFIYKVTQNNVTIQSRVTVNINNRLPILPEVNPISVSRKATTSLSITRNLNVSDPSGGTPQLTEVSISPASVGTVSYSNARDTIIFIPDASMHNAEPTEATLSYTVRSGTNNSQSNSATAVLRIENQAPTINTNTSCCFYTPMSNTESIGIGIADVNGRDADGDSLWFLHLYKDPQYPGTLEKVKADSFVYHPDPSKIGKVVFLAVVTDGLLEPARIGKTNLTLTGSGQDIGNLPVPTEIPGYTYIISQQLGNAGNGLSLKSLGFGNVSINFAQSGFAKLDVFSLSGKNIGTLLNGYQNAGTSEVSIANLNLQKGVYILRLRQGSQIKTLRIVN